ncbi:hypothetical protein [Chamaesiphon polymorphus]|uniref:Type IV secretion system coupling protein TraD DNA-binding domain-containing protein n=1 Tax=Chamaesiphon polymorphus CCALA 037 TaxID=2107692 RepID=A0A2T1GF79_9CYAN|nr:hypothetical protein [Chamaesiphon polymorphus]PSB56149.1 hypothetical protein C7B77_12785 [Chamaesiphon polymorphus CCALA 037]
MTATVEIGRIPSIKGATVPGGAAETLDAIENEFNLETHIEFNAEGRNFGAYLLRLGKSRYRLTFGFDCDGIHPNLPDAQMEAIYQGMTQGFKELPEGEILTVRMNSYADDRERMEYLWHLQDQSPNPALKYIATSEIKKLEVLTAKGKRKAKSLRLFATFTYDADADVKDDRLAAILKKSMQKLGNFTGTNLTQEQEFLSFLEGGFNAFILWEQILKNKIGLNVRALSVEQLWADVWYRFNTTPCIPIPQKAIYDRHTYREVLTSGIHALSLLINDERNLPDADRKWMKIGGKFTAVMSLLDQPDEWDNSRDLINHFWQKLSDDSIVDTEIVCQISKLDQNKVRADLKDITLEELAASERATEDGDIPVIAGANLNEAVAARAALNSGDMAYSHACVVLVRRPDLESLDCACDYLKSIFLYPNNLWRENLYLWKTWMQTLPICWDELLRYPFNRQKRVFSSYLLGTIPLAKVRSTDRSGFELISDDGGVPIAIDLNKSRQHMLVLATQGGGKTAMVCEMMTDFLNQGIPVSLVDCPPTEAASSFKDYTNLVGGAYFDIGSEASNPFDLPDLDSLPERLQNQRHREYQDFLLDLIQAMVVGTRRDIAVDVDRVRSLLSLALAKFFNDFEIRELYHTARTGGIGSPQWADHPTLEHFYEFCWPERIDTQSSDDRRTLEFIRTKLRYWLSSRVGQALSRPSTVRASRPLFVMAMQGVENPDDANILAMCMFGEVIRRALGCVKSICVVEEAALLLKFPVVSSYVGKFCANAGKTGLTMVLIAQEPVSIAECPDGARILANCTIKLVGRIQPEIRRAFQDLLYIPPEILAPTMTDAFSVNVAQGYSKWLLLDGRSYTYVRAYSSPGGLAAVVNNPKEIQRRRELMAAAEHPIIGLHRYACELLPQYSGEKGEGGKGKG